MIDLLWPLRRVNRLVEGLWPLRQFRNRVLQPFLGMVFDLKGGQFHTAGCTFEIPKDEATRPLRYRFLLHHYEESELRLVRRFVNADDSVLELGACLGIVACVTNKRLGQNGRHVVVEANPLCLPALTRNRDINKASFLIEPCAVAARTEGRFETDPSNLTGGKLSSAPTNPVSVAVKSLQQIHRDLGPFNALICDIEGGELELFEGSTDVFRNYRLVIVELHSQLGIEGLSRCRKVLSDAGLELAARDRSVEAWVRRSGPPENVPR